MWSEGRHSSVQQVHIGSLGTNATPSIDGSLAGLGIPPDLIISIVVGGDLLRNGRAGQPVLVDLADITTADVQVAPLG